MAQAKTKARSDSLAASVDASTTGMSVLLREDDHMLGLNPLGSASRSQDGNSVVTTSGNSATTQQHPIHLTVTGTSAMDHLDALGGCQSDTDGSSHAREGKQHKKSANEQVAVGVAVAQEGDNDSNSGHTIGSSNQRLLLEALMMSDRGRRDRLESWGGMSDLSGVGEHTTIGTGAAALAASALHQTGLFDDVTAAAAAIDLPETEPNSANASFASAKDGYHGPTKVPAKIALTRERKYSVASLSDASEDGAPHAHAKAGSEKDQPDIQALVAAAMKSVEGKLGELAAGTATESSVASGNASSATGKISDQEKRNRTWSLGNVSLGFLESGECSLHGSISVPSLPSSVSDTAIQAALDAQTALERSSDPIPEKTISTRARSHSTISALSATGLSTALSTSGLSTIISTKGASEAKPISVDYDAVAAAVSAAEAATGSLNLAEIASMAPPAVGKAGPVPDAKHSVSSEAVSSSSIQPLATPSAKLPPPPADLPPIPKSTMSEKDMEAIRARARAAAGYVPPSDGGSSKRSSDSVCSGGSRAPLKKRRMLPDSVPSSIPGKSAYSTPGAKPPLNPSSKAITSSARFSTPNLSLYTPPTPASALSSASRGQSSQKWDDMFDCLVAFIEEQKKKEQKAAAENKQKWEWDGNVPTTYKTSDGKALGRWINNQRSAKHKGVLKAEREARLIGTGLKWSVLSTNSWTDMMDELRLYVKEKTKDGKPWDGNVPTNYRIKGNGDGDDEDEEKNLGRWINRQRSLYQAGKLKRERQLVSLLIVYGSICVAIKGFTDMLIMLFF